MTPDHRTQIELVPIDRPARRPSEQIPHPRARYFEVPVGTDNLSSTIPHVDNVTYIRWIDRIAEMAGDALGHSRKALAEQDRMWFVAKHEIDYLAETFAGDAVRAATWIHDARKTGCRRDTLLWRDAESGLDVIARARTTWAWIDLTRRRPCRMPQDVIDRLDALHPDHLESSREGRS